MTVLSLIFQLQSVSRMIIVLADVSVSGKGLSVQVAVRKGKSLRRPLILDYPVNPVWLPGMVPMTCFANGSVPVRTVRAIRYEIRGERWILLILLTW